MLTGTPDDGGTWILLHGTPLRPEIWRDVARALTLAPGRVRTPLIRPDPRSADPMAGLVDQVAAALPSEGAIHLVGHSFGGQVAIEIALALAGRFASLTLVCSRDTPYPRFRQIADTVRAASEPDVAGTLSRWFRPEELVDDGPAVRVARDCVQTADLDAWAVSLDLIAGYDRASRMHELAMPVHALAADLDPVSSVDAMRELSRRVQRGRLTVLPGAHMSPFVRPKEFARLVVGADLTSAG